MNDGYISVENGVRLYLRQMGSGEKPILIPNGTYYVDDFASLSDEFTLIAYDPRNRGRSDATGQGNIQTDVDDLEAVRRHFGFEQVDLIGHSYVGLMVALYGMTFAERVRRIVQIGPMQPVAGKQYPAELMFNDGVMGEVFAEIGKVPVEGRTADPVGYCRQVTELLGRMYVVDPQYAGRISWGRCELPNELNFMRYWMGSLMPSIQSLPITPEMCARVKCPVLTIHGRKDRNAPYGGGLDWVSMLPDARMVPVEEAAHAPWIERPDVVSGAIRSFMAEVSA